MTLIQVLLNYRDNVRHWGRDYADKWLERVVRGELWIDIRDSVDDNGDFIDACGNPYCFVSDTVENESRYY